MKNKLVLITLALILVISLVACAAPAPSPTPSPTPSPAPTPPKPTYRLTMATNSPAEHYNVILGSAFVERVKELSDGRIVIDYHIGGVLGDWLPVFEEVMRGSIDLEVTAPSTVHDPRLNIVWIPYAVTNWEEAKAAYSSGGWIFDTMKELNEGLGVATITSIPDGFIGMGATQMPPSPGDPDVPKDMKIRVWAAIPPEKLMERFGYLPTVMPWAETFSALQMGVVEAVYGGSAIATYTRFRDVIEYWLPYRGNYEAQILIMNLELFDSMSTEDRNIIMQAAKEEWQDKRMAEAEQAEAEYTQMMSDYGIEIVNFTQEEYDNFRKVAAADVWPELRSMIGKKLLDDAIASIGGG